jgi:hypothetical protein
MSTNDNNKKQISYTEFFRKRLKQHDAAIKKIILEIKVPTYRKKRSYQEAFAQGHNAFAQGPAGTAFAQLPPYTRFTDELESTNVLESPPSP